MVYRAVAKTTPTQPIHIEWEGGGLFRQIFFVLVVHIWVLGDPNFPAKKRKRNNPFVNGWVQTCVKCQGLSLKRRREHLDLCVGNMRNLLGYVEST